MHEFLMKMERALKNPWFEAVMGLVIMSAGLTEAWSTLYEDLSSGDLGGHHGVILLGLVHTIKAVPAILAGMMLIAHGADHEH